MAEPDYTTVLPVLHSRKQGIAAVMRWHPDADEYRPARVEGPVSKLRAEFLALQWARELQVEYRP